MNNIFNLEKKLTFKECSLSKAKAIEVAKFNQTPSILTKDALHSVSVIPQMGYLIEYLPKIASRNVRIWAWRNMPIGVDSELIFRQFIAQILIDPKCGAFGVSEVSNYHLKKASDLYADQSSELKDFQSAAADATSEYKVRSAEAKISRVSAYSDPETVHKVAVCYAIQAAIYALKIEKADAAVIRAGDAYRLTSIYTDVVYKNQTNLFKEVLKSFK